MIISPLGTGGCRAGGRVIEPVHGGHVTNEESHVSCCVPTGNTSLAVEPDAIDPLADAARVRPAYSPSADGLWADLSRRTGGGNGATKAEKKNPATRGRGLHQSVLWSRTTLPRTINIWRGPEPERPS